MPTHPSANLIAAVAVLLLAAGCAPRVMTTVEPAGERYLVAPADRVPTEMDGYRELATTEARQNPTFFRDLAAQVEKDTAPMLGKGLVLLRAPMPRYPTEALRNEIEGVVQVEFLVNPEGRVAHAKILQSAGGVLDRECLRVIMLWEFEPFTVHGEYRSVVLRQKFPFVLEP